MKKLKKKKVGNGVKDNEKSFENSDKKFEKNDKKVVKDEKNDKKVVKDEKNDKKVVKDEKNDKKVVKDEKNDKKVVKDEKKGKTFHQKFEEISALLKKTGDHVFDPSSYKKLITEKNFGFSELCDKFEKSDIKVVKEKEGISYFKIGNTYNIPKKSVKELLKLHTNFEDFYKASPNAVSLLDYALETYGKKEICEVFGVSLKLIKGLAVAGKKNFAKKLFKFLQV